MEDHTQIINVEAQLARRLWDHADEIAEQARAAREAGNDAGAAKLMRQVAATRDTAINTVARAHSLPDGTPPADLEPVRYEPLTDNQKADRAKRAEESAQAIIRADRNALLAASDWTQIPDAPLTDKQRAAWAAYRQKLRDLPTSKTHDFPKPPAT